MSALLQITGLAAVQKRLGAIAPNVIREADGVMGVAANSFANKAIADAPVDQSLLRQGISALKVGELNHEVVSAADYSPYIEWGTKSKAVIPADLKEYAAKFRGNGGDGHGFFESILAWVKRKGIAATLTKTGKQSKSKKADQAQYTAARLIYYSILKNGIKPHPFFFKQMEPVLKELRAELPKAVKRAMK